MHSFELAYQPKFQHDRVISLEALLRPLHCDNVEQFVRNHSNPIKLDKMVISHVLSDIENHKIDLKIAVNVSARSLINSEFMAFCLEKIPGRPIYLELTEYDQELTNERLFEHIRTLQRHQINVSLDDFGSGNAHSILLANNQFNEIKIDRSYSQDVAKNIRFYKHLHLATNLIKSMGPCDIVYEGIETLEQYELIKEINENAIFQGYFFQKPTTINELVKRHLN